MNINKYIEKHSKINDDKKGKLSITLCVPLKKEITYARELSEDSEHVKLGSQDIALYLEHKGYKNLKVIETHSIDNKHPRGLNATWVFKYANQKVARKRKTSSEK